MVKHNRLILMDKVEEDFGSRENLLSGYDNNIFN